nr:hypothetical protein [Tanacetum cinerariifolium]
SNRFKNDLPFKPRWGNDPGKLRATPDLLISNTSQSSSMLKTTGKSFKKYNLSVSNSFSALNDEEDVENVYDESANLIQNTKACGSSSFTVAAG